MGRFKALLLALLCFGCDDEAATEARDARTELPEDASLLDAFIRDAAIPDALPEWPEADALPDVPVPDAADLDMAFADAAIPDAAIPDAAPPVICPDPVPGKLGVHVRDVNLAPLTLGDQVEVTVKVIAPQATEQPVWIHLINGNVDLDRASFRLDGAPIEVLGEGRVVTVPLPRLAAGTLTYTGTVASDRELMVVLAQLRLTQDECPNPHAGSGALLQLIGGNGKTPLCIPAADYDSLQISPEIPLDSTRAYRDANGVREDLMASDFIFCPQRPVVVHSAEFCVVTDPTRSISLAGQYTRDGHFEVDDFLLLEVFQLNERVNRAFTTQTHPGGNTFWCGETQQLMCQTPCTASLTDDQGERVPVLATAPATGGNARQHQDGAVKLDALLPSGEGVVLRATALDQGEVGTVRPALYLVMDPR